jgi:Sap, sulfolipid-1-addressing protein
VLLQATGFALLAAVSPAGLLVMAVFLASANPRATALGYVAGAAVMTVAMAVTFLLVLRAAGLAEPHHHGPRYALRLGLGALALLVAALVAWRGRRARLADRGSKAKKGPGFIARLITRLTAQPRPATAFLAGLLLFAPSTTFIAAVQVVATAKVSTPDTVAGMLVVVVLSAATAWLPLLAYLAAPGVTTRTLALANRWLRAHGRTALVAALAIAGIALVIDGALGVMS